LIEKYEQDHWSESLKITDKQVKENDLTEILVRAENEFNYKRKELINF